jgi:hypothetical protein
MISVMPCCSMTATCTASRAESRRLPRTIAFAFDDGGVDGEYLVNHPDQRIEGGLNRVAPVDGHVTMQDLLQHLGIGDEALTVRDALLEESLGVGLVRVHGANEVHRNVGIDQDHRRDSST